MRFHEFAEATKPKKPTEPKGGIIKPMTPAEHHREADREQRVQAQVRDTQAAAARKVNNLRSRL